ncbi:hypothetical protein HBI21_083060 [Parastagonospora nodorum]|nr:hypothetical protein HBI21_083060 [Parastagonospora nodorum]
MSPNHFGPDQLRIELAHALGFPEYPATTASDPEPYLNYIANRNVGRGTSEGFLELIIQVVEYFKQGNETSISTPSIQGLLDGLSTPPSQYFSDAPASTQPRRDDVEDTVMYILGIWTMLLSSFVHLPVAGGARKITLAYTIRAQGKSNKLHNSPYDGGVSSLITGSGLLPSAGQWGLPQSSDDNSAMVQAAVTLRAALRRTQGSSSVSMASSGGSVHSLQNLDTLGHNNTSISLRFLDDLDSLESLHVAATRLNAYTLRVFGAVDIVWTHNLSRHMLLCKRNGQYVLEVFALPCALSATTLTSSAVGISAEYAQEITESYSILFNAWPDTPRHTTISSAFGARRFCWCWSCSAHRYRHQLISTYQKLSDKRTPGAKRSKNAHASEFDPLLVELMRNEPSDWTPDLFPSLWPRIMILEEHLQSAKPWNIWILFRDRRDTLQFWTFFFATVVVMLTFVQVILGVAQVVGSFA